MQQVRYRNTLDDLIALQKFVLRHTSLGRKMMLHRFIMVEIIIFLICSLFAFNHNPIKVLLMFIVLSGLAWLFRERSVLVQFRKDFRREDRRDKTGAFHRDRTMSIDASGITVNSGNGQNSHTWDQVELVNRDAKYVYIVLKGVLHHVIPLSAFRDANHTEQFMTATQTFRSEA